MRRLRPKYPGREERGTLQGNTGGDSRTQAEKNHTRFPTLPVCSVDSLMSNRR